MTHLFKENKQLRKATTSLNSRPPVPAVRARTNPPIQIRDLRTQVLLAPSTFALGPKTEENGGHKFFRVCDLRSLQFENCSW